MRCRECEADSDRCVYRVSARSQHVEPDLSGKPVDAHDSAMAADRDLADARRPMDDRGIIAARCGLASR